VCVCVSLSLSLSLSLHQGSVLRLATWPFRLSRSFAPLCSVLFLSWLVVSHCLQRSISQPTCATSAILLSASHALLLCILLGQQCDSRSIRCNSTSVCYSVSIRTMQGVVISREDRERRCMRFFGLHPALIHLPSTSTYSCHLPAASSHADFQWSIG
jgi:hypothetical protein